MELPIIIILGTPRSGTTMLGRILDRHPSVSTWMEPYYIWDHFFREAPHDELEATDATDMVSTWLRKAFADYQRASGVKRVVDKSPRNCLKIPFIRNVFPEARYIVLLRDGRDTILSISKQWENKKEIFKNKVGWQWVNRFAMLKKWLRRRPLWRSRMQSILFELGPPRYWFDMRFLNKIRWGGRFGWGPRFKGWEEFIDRISPLEFSAQQWVHCARSLLDNLALIGRDRCLIIKYEDILENPEKSLKDIFSFLDLYFPERFMETIPPVWKDNSNKWRKSIPSKALADIGPIIGKTLIDSGYEKDETWYQQGKSLA